MRRWRLAELCGTMCAQFRGDLPSYLRGGAAMSAGSGTHVLPRGRDEFGAAVEPYRRELQLHCYRMLGSLQDAEDLVQETLLRAWRKQDTFEGKAPVRAWLYRIATNACLDELDRRPRRTLPHARGAAADAGLPPAQPILDPIWLEPYPDGLTSGLETGPEARYDLRESISLAFLTMLQLLPPRQRAVLILSDVLDWRASEVSQALDLTVSAVASALHRARTTMAARSHTGGQDPPGTQSTDESIRALLDQYVHAWETADVDALVSLLKEDARLPMPPSPSWYRGRDAIRMVVSHSILAGGDAAGRWTLKPTRANARPAFAWYLRDESSRNYRAFGIQVITIEDRLIAEMATFPNPDFLRFFGFPPGYDAVRQ